MRIYSFLRKYYNACSGTKLDPLMLHPIDMHVSLHVMPKSILGLCHLRQSLADPPQADYDDEVAHVSRVCLPLPLLLLLLPLLPLPSWCPEERTELHAYK